MRKIKQILFLQWQERNTDLLALRHCYSSLSDCSGMCSDELESKDQAGKIICCGVGTIVALQAFLNISVATGIAPNTGTPLPFVSYGLTSLVSMFIGMGFVLNVGLHGRAYKKDIEKKDFYQKEEYL